jgi:hypothetical protein
MGPGPLPLHHPQPFYHHYNSTSLCMCPYVQKRVFVSVYALECVMSVTVLTLFADFPEIQSHAKVLVRLDGKL